MIALLVAGLLLWLGLRGCAAFLCLARRVFWCLADFLAVGYVFLFHLSGLCLWWLRWFWFGDGLLCLGLGGVL